MELNEKLQELRKQKGLTQVELAQALFVSRTAVSKWESGRGYPNIESLKGIAKFFGVTVDELLSGDELLTIAEEDARQTKSHFCDLVFGLLDISIAMFFFLPFFGEKSTGTVHAVSLPALAEIATYLKIAYYGIVIGIVLLGICMLALQNFRQQFWVRHKSHISLMVNAVGVILFVISLQPYPAIVLFLFLIIKALLFRKKE